jgi:hypothetical protein
MTPEKTENAGSSLTGAESRNIENSSQNYAADSGEFSEARRRVMKRVALSAFAAPVILASMEAKAAPISGFAPT